MAFELPAVPNFNVQQPQPFDPLAFQQREATLSGLLNENKLKQQLAPLNVQEAQGRVQAQDIENQIKTIQLQGQRALSDWLQNGDANEEVPTSKFSSNDKIATYVGVTPDDPIMSVVRSMAQHHVPAPMLMAEAQGMLQRRNEYYKGTKEEQDAQKAERLVWQTSLAELHEMPEDQRSIALATKLPLLQENSKTDPLLGAYAKGLAGHPELIDQAYNVLSAENAALGLRKAKSEAAKAGSEATKAQMQLPGGAEENPEQKFLRLQSAANQGQKLNAEDQAYVKAYEKNKTMVPAFNFNMQAGALNDAALDQAAQRYLETGQLPAGMRSPAMSSKILSRAGELGGGQNIAANSAAYKANQASYENVTKTLDTLSAFEQTGLKNLKQFTDLAAKIPDTGVPWVNSPIRTLDEKAVGSANMAAVQAARAVALREIARVTNDPKLSGQLSDHAREEVENLVPANATFNQIKAVATVLQSDMANVHSSLAAQKDDIGKRLGLQAHAPSGEAAPFQAPAGAPKAPSEDGHKLKMNGAVVAVSKGGSWVAP